MQPASYLQSPVLEHPSVEDITGALSAGDLVIYPTTDAQGLLTDKGNGVKSFDITFTATASDALAASATSYAWDLDGDGKVDFECPSASSVTASYSKPGLYAPTLTVKDSYGVVHTDTMIVNVMDYLDMQAVFRDIWSKMRTALLAGDIETELKYHTVNYKEKYRAIFNALGADGIQSVYSGLSEVYLNFIAGPYAEGFIFRQENGKYYSYPVHFALGDDGRWGVYGY